MSINFLSSSLVILNLPIAWILLLLGYSPVFVFVARVLINLIVAIIRVLYIKSFLGFPIKSYLEMITIRAIPVTMVALGFSASLTKSEIKKPAIEQIKENACPSVLQKLQQRQKEIAQREQIRTKPKKRSHGMEL